MIRHVSVFILKPGADRVKVLKGIDLVRDNVPGALRSAYGADAGLRAGNGDIGVSFDFESEAAYQAWDTHPEHERIRREIVLPQVASVMRAQFRLER